MQFAGFLAEDVDEEPADDFAFPLWVGDAGQGAQKSLDGIDRNQIQALLPLKDLCHLFGFVLAQQAVIDKDADKLVADGAVDQGRGHR